MGADLIGLGWTVRARTEPDATTPTRADLLALVFRHRHDLLRDADIAQTIEPDVYTPGERVAKIADGIAIAIADGPYRDTVAYAFTVGDDRRWFLFAGGLSWGDDPFTGFEDLDAALTAAEIVPEIGALFRFVGRGIDTTA